MDVFHEGVKVGRDNNGIYLIIKFSKDMVDKIYIDEFFEDAAENDNEIDISIKPHVKLRARPKGFFDKLDPKERERIKNELDLRESYLPTQDHLNVYKYLLRKYQKNPPELDFDKLKIDSIEKHKEFSKKIKEKVIELTNYNLNLSNESGIDYLKNAKNRKELIQYEEGPSTEFENLILKKYYIHTAEDLILPAVLTMPKNLESNLPAVICVHGHNKGKINTLGMLESSSNSYYGIELAKEGFITLSLDQWGWGERLGFNKKRADNSEAVFSLSAQLLGLTAIGLRSWEVSRSIDFLEQLDITNGKYGIIGQSGGGTTSAFSSVLDDRIEAAVVSGYFCSWIYSIFAMHHCPCNFVPGILKYMDLGDMMASRAPKPLFVVAGERDSIFPIEGVKKAYNKAKKAYKLYGKEDYLGIDIIPETGHVFRGDYSYPWLKKYLF